MVICMRCKSRSAQRFALASEKNICVVCENIWLNYNNTFVYFAIAKQQTVSVLSASPSLSTTSPSIHTDRSALLWLTLTIDACFYCAQKTIARFVSFSLVGADLYTLLLWCGVRVCARSRHRRERDAQNAWNTVKLAPSKRNALQLTLLWVSYYFFFLFSFVTHSGNKNGKSRHMNKENKNNEQSLHST